MANERKVECDAAVRGFHYYRRYWTPKTKESLMCNHEQDNPFDIFAIKVCTEDGSIVGHLPREISRPCKFLLDRGASIVAKLTSEKYRRSPLVQGGLEIACKLHVWMKATLKNMELLKRFTELVDSMYTEPDFPIELGSILADEFEVNTQDLDPEPRRKKAKPKTRMEKTTPKVCRDIRLFFQHEKTLSSTKADHKTRNVVVIDE